MRALIQIAIIAALPTLAHAEVTPAAVAPVQHGGMATSVAVTVTQERRVVGFQFGIHGNGLFQVGIASAIDDTSNESAVQGNLAAGFRIPFLYRSLGTAGRLRISAVARGVAEGGAGIIGDGTEGGRAGVDGGLSMWLAAPGGSSGGILVGAAHPFVGGEMHGTELQVSGMLIMALYEPEVASPARDAAAIDELLTGDPAKWPEGGPRPPDPNTDERTYLSVGLTYARAYQNDMTPERVMITVGVVYP